MKHRDRFDWNFSRIPKKELVACCFYEYARESRSIVDYFDRRKSPSPSSNFCQKGPKQKWYESEEFLRHPLTLSFPSRLIGQPIFDCAWREKPAAWRTAMRKSLAGYLKGWKANPFVLRSKMKGFAVGIPPYFHFQLLKEQVLLTPGPPPQYREEWTTKPRTLDRATGLEVLTVTIDWANFDNGEIKDAFNQWIEDHNRPKRIGKRDKKGRPKDYLSCLKRLVLLRLRHCYPFEEMSKSLPVKWADEEKFQNRGECNRECDLVKEDFHAFFPFLPPREKPISWTPLK